jgi:hypothetical protein
MATTATRQEDWTVEDLLEEWSVFPDEKLSRRKMAFLQRAHELDIELLERGERIALNPAPRHITEPCILPSTYWPVALACALDLIDERENQSRLTEIISLLFSAGLIDHRHSVMCLEPDPGVSCMDDQTFADNFGKTPDDYNRLQGLVS